MALSNIQWILGISGIFSLLLNIVLIAIMIKLGKPIIDQIRGKFMKNPTYIVRVHNKNRADMELVDYIDGIVKLGKKTYIKDPELIIRHKPFDLAFFMAEDCRPLNLSEVELILDPEVYTRQLELAEMAGSARMIERLVEELMTKLLPYLIAMVAVMVICIGAMFMLHQQGQKTYELLNLVYDVTKPVIVEAVTI